MSARNEYTLEITAPALGDIEEIATYTTVEWGEAQALTYLEQIDKTILSLADNPRLGRQRFGVPSAIKGRKSGAHVVFYRIEESTIYVLRILHESMDHGRHIEGDR